MLFIVGLISLTFVLLNTVFLHSPSWLDVSPEFLQNDNNGMLLAFLLCSSGVGYFAFRTMQRSEQKTEELLLNVLPENIAEELKSTGSVQPIRIESASVLFTDFKGFTGIAEKLSPEEVVRELDRCFSFFDSLMDLHRLEKLKTIGDSFMCVGGAPISNSTHAVDCVLAALEIQSFIGDLKQEKAEQGKPYWELRLGIHTGPLVGGVIGEKKFAYDVWGDTVNTASRAESSGLVGRVNITSTTNSLVEEFFVTERRGFLPMKGKGQVEMFFVNAIKPGMSLNGQGREPNRVFRERYEALAGC